MLVTLFLCLVNTLNSVSETSPNTQSVPTAIVSWIIVCMVFVLGALVSYAWILYRQVHGGSDKNLKAGDPIKVTPAQKISQPITTPSPTIKIQKMDKILLSAFPVSFVISTIMFFIAYKNI